MAHPPALPEGEGHREHAVHQHRYRPAHGKGRCQSLRSPAAQQHAAQRGSGRGRHPAVKAPGRGAYLCPNPECLKKAIRAKALERAFDTQIPQEILEQLLQTMEAQANE